MKQRQRDAETEALRVYQKYWESYLGGDLVAFSSTIDDRFEMIGTSEGEVCHSKADGIAFYKAQMAEVVGKVEMRNSQTTSVLLDPLVLINETCDVYVKTDEGWNFYSKLRLSTLLKETNEGWKVVQQHGSLPDMRVADGETIAIEKISKENLELRDAIKRRTIELENKNRELAIEAALEKVRAVAMGMKKPEEMLDVCRVISEQLEQFGVEKIRNIQTAIIDETIGQYLCYQYFTPYNKTAVEKTEYLKSPVEEGMVKQMLASRDGFFIGGLCGKELETFRSHRKEENHFPDPFLDEATQLDYCFLSIGEGGLGLTLYQPMTEVVLTLFKRFHQVFSLAYQRFRDIQKAEAQAREAQIEAAVERVRAEAMAMHSTEDFGKVAQRLLQQVQGLGIKGFTGATIYLVDESEFITGYDFSAFGGLKDAKHQILRYDANKFPHIGAYPLKEWKKGTSYFELDFDFEKLQAGAKEFEQIDLSIANSLKEALASGKLTHQWAACGRLKNGFIAFDMVTLPNEDVRKITIKMGYAFNQAYTRFLDLQKAEAQAREAEIELALERVRARTMAMHHTEELKEVIQVVFDQFVGLNIHVEHAGFILDYKEQENMHIWLADHQQGVPTEITIPYFDSPHWNSYLEAKANQKSFFANLLPFEVKNKFYRDLFKLIPELTEEAQQAIFGKPGLAISTVLLENVGLYIEHYSETPFTAEENAILMRFGKVFQQTYTRFLDLQKAEAQARESQIQLALERVRARTMAMHKSQELAEVAVVLYQELKTLGATQDFFECGYVEVDEPNNIQRAWSTRPDGSFLEEPYYLPLTGEPVIDARYEAWKQRIPVCHQPVGGELLKRANEFVIPYMNNQEAAEITSSSAVPDPVHFYCGNFSHGYLNINCGEPLSAEEESLLARFTGVFEMTYQRFLDLQKAEAQAREAQIETAMERIRARAMAMHSSSELLEVAQVLREQMGWLNQPDLETSAVLIYHDDQNSWDSWYAFRPTQDYNGVIRNCIATFNKDDCGFTREIARRFQLPEKDYTLALSGAEREEWIEVLMKAAPEIAENALANETVNFDTTYFHFSDFSGGSLLTVTYHSPSEEIKSLQRRAASVFDLAYRRFLDLQKAEAQARESQIQLALERVRARTMAMQKSSELPEAANLLFQQIQSLGMPAWSAGYCSWDDDEKSSVTLWMSSEGVLQPPFSAPTKEDQLFIQMRVGAEEGKDLHVVDLGGEELEQHYRYMRELPVVGEILDSIIEAGHQLPTFQIMHQAYFSKGFLLFITYEPVPESHGIFKRFAKVFDQTYTRFLDLQKAEAQAREAQIEAALEKVRGRTMAMQSSNELADAAYVLFEQLNFLGVTHERINIGIVNEDNHTIDFWVTEQGGIKLSTKFSGRISEPTTLSKAYHSWKKGEKSLVVDLIGEELKNWLHYLNEEIKIPFNKAYLHSRRVQTAGFFSKGMLILTSPEPLNEEALYLLEKFAGVFDLTYTRFNDLKIAEAQAREAQIEAALERVRSRTVGMQKSNELRDVIQVIYEQFIHLGIDLYGAAFAMDYRESEDWHIWSADLANLSPTLLHIPYFDHPYWNTWNDAKLKGLDTLAYTMAFAEKNSFVSEFGKHIPNLPAEAFELILSTPGYTVSNVFLKNVTLYIDRFTTEPYSDADNAILMRFGKVFEQTYTRFKDLEKAEAQAREAQIEAALERVRSRTMAMQRSEELPEVAGLLFQQVKALGVPQFHCGFNIFEIDDKECTWYPGSADGDILPPCKIPLTEHPIFMNFIESRKRGDELCVYEKEGEYQAGHYKYMLSLPVLGEMLQNMLDAGIPFPTFQIDHLANFSHGNLLFITSEHFPEMHDTFKRFAKVFEQTYSRFLDLQKAEAQARESQIQLALERVRARTMAMHKSQELAEAAVLLYRELKGLGVSQNFFECGYVEVDETNNIQRGWSTRPDGSFLKEPFFLPLTGEPVADSRYEAWIKRVPVFHQEVGGDQMKHHVEFALPYFGNQEAIDISTSSSIPDPIHFYCGNFDHGYLNINCGVPLSAEEESLLVRFTRVFEMTYQRFLDLQKAEAQAREAQIEAALERVRSKTMAMHNSQEVGESVATLFEELISLDVLHPDERCGIGIMHPDHQMEAWTAAKTAEGKAELTIGYLDMALHPLLVSAYQGWVEKKDVNQYLMEGDDKIRYHEAMLSQPNYKIKRDYYSGTTRIIHVDFYFKEGCLYVFSQRDLSPESLNVYSRFATVFGQTYRRYQDLLKAEAQAREAQIEAAMEKVRSRSLAMQSPDELIEVAQLLREEMGALGVEELETSSIYIHDANSGLTECWFTIKNTANPDKAVTDQMTIRFEDTWVGRQMREFFQSSAEKTSIVMRGENRLEWIHYCEGKTNLFGTSNFYGDTIPDRTYHLYKFSNGYIGAAAPGEISQESWDLLRRATTVFSFAFTRFQDLQNAQASARAAMRQASLDRIRADISSMRNAEDLDRITPLIFKELTVLGVPFIRCGVFIIQEKQKIVEAYLSSPEGNSLGVLRLPYQASELTYQTVEAWRKGMVYRQHWSKEDFIQWINQLMEQDQIQDSSTYQGTAAPPESLDLHFVPFTQGMLYVGAVNPLEENELELVQALAKAFSIAYARYEDFVKLEQAKAEVESAMTELKSTQAQLIQQEKLASLGQLTAGIAHEIKNPLNFVNNFSEVSIEMIGEVIDSRLKTQDTRPKTEADEIEGEILEDIKANLEKIHEHGSRANGIVTSMLQHSRGGSGKKEPTDLNALIKEYVNLSFHGMRAGKDPINVEIALDLDDTIKEIPLVREDFTRVIINLCNNAFDAMRQKFNSELYHPKLTVHTKSEKDHILISVEDNGPGIPDGIKDKILQPFFTTKKGTEGTGLGLSITHDIIKAHGGELEIETSVNKGTTFIIKLTK
jgi:signal transduction histidine kinase